jgi:hypothetical protein
MTKLPSISAWLLFDGKPRKFDKRAEPTGGDSGDTMRVIPLEQFPSFVPGVRRFQTVQILWDQDPKLRPVLAKGMRRMCQSISRVVRERKPL